jgi:hypothetical protein
MEEDDVREFNYYLRESFERYRELERLGCG